MPLNNEDRLALEIKRLYLKKWRAEHKENVKKHNEQYWKRKAVKLLAEQNDEKEM